MVLWMGLSCARDPETSYKGHFKSIGSLNDQGLHMVADFITQHQTITLVSIIKASRIGELSNSQQSIVSISNFSGKV